MQVSRKPKCFDGFDFFACDMATNWIKLVIESYWIAIEFSHRI